MINKTTMGCLSVGLAILKKHCQQKFFTRNGELQKKIRNMPKLSRNGKLGWDDLRHWILMNVIL